MTIHAMSKPQWRKQLGARPTGTAADDSVRHRLELRPPRAGGGRGHLAAQADGHARAAAQHREFAEFDPEGRDQTALLARLANFLADLSSALAVATPAERNRLARELSDKVLIDNRTAVAVRPRPELRPFFSVVALEEKSSDVAPDLPETASALGCQVSANLTQRRKRRVPALPHPTLWPSTVLQPFRQDNQSIPRRQIGHGRDLSPMT